MNPIRGSASPNIGRRSSNASSSSSATGGASQHHKGLDVSLATGGASQQHKVQELSLASIGMSLAIACPPAGVSGLAGSGRPDLTSVELRPPAAMVQLRSPKLDHHKDLSPGNGNKKGQISRPQSTGNRLFEKGDKPKKKQSAYGASASGSDSENSENDSVEDLNHHQQMTAGTQAANNQQQAVTGSQTSDVCQKSSSNNRATNKGGGKRGGGGTSVEIGEPQHHAPNRLVGADWVILQGLRSGQQCEEVPVKFEGYIMKSRKWPMKGWHKRYFLLDKGILTYAKSPTDLDKGKQNGTMDIGLSVIAYKKNGRRIDVDADDLIYHLKASSSKSFEEWIEQLRHHRLYRQHEISFGSKDVPKLIDISTPIDESSSPLASPMSPGSPVPPIGSGSQRGSFKSGSLDRMQSRVATWLIDSHGHDAWNKELTAAQLKIFSLSSMLQKLHSESSLNSLHEFPDMSTSSSSSSKKEKSNRKYILGNKSKERKNKDRLSAPNGMLNFHASSSNPNLLTLEEAEQQLQQRNNLMAPPSESSGISCSSNDLLHDQFCAQAKNVVDTLKGICRTLTTERERLKQALEQESLVSTQYGGGSNAAYVHSLKQALAEAVKQNTELRSRLQRIHSESAAGIELKPQLSSLILPGSSAVNSGPPSEKGGHERLASSVSIDSTIEFYDAAEKLDYSVSDESEEEEEEDETDNISDTETNAIQTSDAHDGQFGNFRIRRRSKLPVPRVESDVSMWSLLCKNIGKDLSKIAMPVSLNEPLGALQRLCEELEYSELLDRVAEIADPYERMVLVAAFSISAYSSTYTRASQKPFNPLLGETYECVREDKGWKFMAEQVSHHPPVAACFCESRNFIFWQDTQVKTKFWGKSMEVQPVGLVYLKLPKFKEQYSWNKATTCIHNILGGQRWVDHFGEVNINNSTLNINCKLTYVKSSYWSAKKHELYGKVTGPDGQTVHHLFGRWNEGIYYGDSHSAKCIWRPGSMPPDSDIYYGFTRFAIELNEIDQEQVHLYPPTDTRFRPDQRLLEEGKVDEADIEKQRLEQLQREQRKMREEENVHYVPNWFTKVEEEDNERYVYNNKYWEMRKDPGFMKLSLPKLW